MLQKLKVFQNHGLENTGIIEKFIAMFGNNQSISFRAATAAWNNTTDLARVAAVVLTNERAAQLMWRVARLAFREMGKIAPELAMYGETLCEDNYSTARADARYYVPSKDVDHAAWHAHRVATGQSARDCADHAAQVVAHTLAINPLMASEIRDLIIAAVENEFC